MFKCDFVFVFVVRADENQGAFVLVQTFERLFSVSLCASSVCVCVCVCVCVFECVQMCILVVQHVCVSSCVYLRI